MGGPKEQDGIHPTLTKGMQVMGQTHRRSRLGAAADLMILARGGNVEDLAELAQEVDICKATDSQGFTSLHLAAIGDHAETIRRLISLGAHIEARTPAGETPLHVAAQRGCSNAVKTLLELGADANAKDDAFNDTPLHKSTWGGHKACILLLLQAGADSRARDEDGCPPSELAKINHQPEALAVFQTAMSSMRVRSPNQRANSLRRRNPIEFMLHPRK